jgi:MYXO-CTERM domain-containing protein
VRNPNHLRVKKGRFLSKVARAKKLHRTGKIGHTKPGAHIATSSISSVSASPGIFLSPVSAGVQVPGALAHDSNFAALVYSSSDGKVYKPFLGTGKFAGFSFGTGPTALYGWVQLNISQNDNGSFNVTVVSDAIEQCPGQPIQAGLTSGGADCTTPPPPTTPAPSSLLLMSLGVAGLAGLETLRRRRKTA